MDKITAENELKEKTAEYVKAALQNGRQEFHNIKTNSRNGIFTMRKFAYIAASFLICAGMTTGAYAYYKTPVKYISIDINPSVELGVNAFDTVVTTTSYNEDGAAILAEVEVTNMNVEEAVSAIVEEASEQGFVAEDGSTVISVTSESNNENTAEKLQDAGEEGVQTALKAKNILAVVYANSASLELRTAAKELGISPGKYKMINILTTLDPTIKAEDYKSAKVTEIFLKADELMKANPTAAADMLDLKDVNSAAEKVKTAKGNAEKNTNGEANKGVETQVQVQNQYTGDKTPENETEKNGNGGVNSNGNGQGKKGVDTSAVPSPTDEPTPTTAPVAATAPSSVTKPSVAGNSDNDNKGNGNSGNSSSGSGNSSKGNGKS